MFLNKSEKLNRLAGACKIYDNDNAISLIRINSALSLINKKSERTVVDDTVAEALETAKEMLLSLRDVLFTGENSVNYKIYFKEKLEYQRQLHKLAKEIKEHNDSIIYGNKKG